jgi:hypothetical protein
MAVDVVLVTTMAHKLAVARADIRPAMDHL